MQHYTTKRTTYQTAEQKEKVEKKVEMAGVEAGQIYVTPRMNSGFRCRNALPIPPSAPVMSSRQSWVLIVVGV